MCLVLAASAASLVGIETKSPALGMATLAALMSIVTAVLP